MAVVVVRYCQTIAIIMFTRRILQKIRIVSNSIDSLVIVVIGEAVLCKNFEELRAYIKCGMR